MSKRVDPKTLLFSDLTKEEAKVLTREMEDIVLRGSNHYASEFFRSWCKEAGYEERNLLVFATAYPQRALLSLLYHTTVHP